MKVRVSLPPNLRDLARTGPEVVVEVTGAVTPESVLDAVEERYPMLKGTIRDHVTRKRRAFVRYFAGGEDRSHDPTDAPLPQSVADGTEPFLVVGAIAGG